MSQTAASISASNLAQRIDTADVDSELGKLGQILNAMFARLEAAFEQQVRFTADASHELRTPLSVILSHVELSLNRERSGEEYRHTLETCLRAARRMKTLVDDLLLLARADAGKLELRFQPVDLAQVCRECLLLLTAMAQQRSVRLSESVSPADVKGDPDRLARVVTNLVCNAILYNRPGGTVSVTTARNGAAVDLTVTDTGQGIPEADLPHVFERFYRADKSRTPDAGGGSGLGLAICKSLIEAHGGAISVVSQPGLGTTFVIRLPSAVEQDLPAIQP